MGVVITKIIIIIIIIIELFHNSVMFIYLPPVHNKE